MFVSDQILSSPGDPRIPTVSSAPSAPSVASVPSVPSSATCNERKLIWLQILAEIVPKKVQFP